MLNASVTSRESKPVGIADVIGVDRLEAQLRKLENEGNQPWPD
jgi:hypothetical protein